MKFRTQTSRQAVDLKDKTRTTLNLPLFNKLSNLQECPYTHTHKGGLCFQRHDVFIQEPRGINPTFVLLWSPIIPTHFLRGACNNCKTLNSSLFWEPRPGPAGGMCAIEGHKYTHRHSSTYRDIVLSIYVGLMLSDPGLLAS